MTRGAVHSAGRTTLFREAGGSGLTALDMATFGTTADKMCTVGPDFQEFISSVRPRPG
ncbi:hypothetical protein GCM10009676_26870 [Prauserella halophila]|uniref:Uncharacterized protein n=1 Tax=Prauserella halophila TaxID=185641 RepID=A0ABN1W8T6_9PSEU|nr:hypothetical protein [Prauserella halophila]